MNTEGGARRIIIFGATGRVGRSLVDYALEAGHHVTAFARTPSKITRTHSRLSVVQGDIYQPQTVRRALEAGFDDVVMVVGDDPLKASTVVRDTVSTLIQAMEATGLTRYLGITGTAQMPATPLGALTQFFIRRLIKAAADHQAAYALIAASSLDYVLAACPYIKDGPRTARYRRVPGRFPGGYRTISPEDVADFFAQEIQARQYHRQVIGIWS